MTKQNFTPIVSVVIASYNEAQRLHSVLQVLTTHPHLSEIIVVNDGSTDNTCEVLRTYPIINLTLPINKGKGYALEVGVRHAKGNILFFCDADMTGMTHAIIDEMLLPVTQGQVDVSIAMQHRALYRVRSLLLFTPLISGDRVLTKKLWNRIPAYYKHGFRIEVGINFYARYTGKGLRGKAYTELSQAIKEKKYGYIEGFKRRLFMMRDILVTIFYIQFHDIPSLMRHHRQLLTRRLMLFNYSVSVLCIGTGVGIVLLRTIPPFNHILSALSIGILLILSHIPHFIFTFLMSIKNRKQMYVDMREKKGI